MEPFIFPMERDTVPGGLFETPNQFDFNDGSTTNLESMWMDVDVDITNSSTLSLFQELEHIPEVTTNKFIDLNDVIEECGIPVEEEVTVVMPESPASLASDMETHQSLIEELEEFFGSPTRVDESEDRGLDLLTTATVPYGSPSDILAALQSGRVLGPSEEIITEQDLRNAVTTTCVTEDGQNVIIIIAPSSPAPASPTYSIVTSDSDPDWSPSPSPGLRNVAATSHTIRKKYARSKPPTAPTGPYPVEKKERKKAQNRTAAFRYREKKKNEQDGVDGELDQLQDKNDNLKEQLTEMEAECRLLKKLMTEAGLGRYASTLNL